MLLTKTKHLVNAGTSTPISAARIESQLLDYICAVILFSSARFFCPTAYLHTLDLRIWFENNQTFLVNQSLLWVAKTLQWFQGSVWLTMTADIRNNLNILFGLIKRLLILCPWRWVMHWIHVRTVTWQFTGNKNKSIYHYEEEMQLSLLLGTLWVHIAQTNNILYELKLQRQGNYFSKNCFQFPSH
jgi:hypothetical protein